MGKEHDTLQRIDSLCQKRGWEKKKLAEETGIALSTIMSWYDKGFTPTVKNLNKICNSFGMSISEFYSDNYIECTYSEAEIQILEIWNHLKEEQRYLTYLLMKTM